MLDQSGDATCALHRVLNADKTESKDPLGLILPAPKHWLKLVHTYLSGF